MIDYLEPVWRQSILDVFDGEEGHGLKAGSAELLVQLQPRSESAALWSCSVYQGAGMFVPSAADGRFKGL